MRKVIYGLRGVYEIEPIVRNNRTTYDLRCNGYYLTLTNRWCKLTKRNSKYGVFNSEIEAQVALIDAPDPPRRK